MVFVEIVGLPKEFFKLGIGNNINGLGEIIQILKNKKEIVLSLFGEMLLGFEDLLGYACSKLEMKWVNLLRLLGLGGLIFLIKKEIGRELKLMNLAYSDKKVLHQNSLRVKQLIIEYCQINIAKLVLNFFY